MKHKHIFELTIEKATGYMEKQQGQHNIITCEGSIYRCKCRTAILVPEREGLRIVEVECD